MRLMCRQSTRFDPFNDLSIISLDGIIMLRFHGASDDPVQVFSVSSDIILFPGRETLIGTPLPRIRIRSQPRR